MAAALERYSPAQLVGFARQLAPRLIGQDFAYAGTAWNSRPSFVGCLLLLGMRRQPLRRYRKNPPTPILTIATMWATHVSNSGQEIRCRWPSRVTPTCLAAE